MKTLLITTTCLCTAMVTFGQTKSSTAGVSSNSSNIQVGSTTTTTTTSTSTHRDNGISNYNYSSNDYGSTNSNSNSNSNSNWNTNSNTNSNSNSNSNWGSNNNNNSYNSNYNSNYNNGYSNNNYNNNNSNSNYSTYSNQSYKVKDDNYGSKLVTEDEGAKVKNIYNTTERVSIYKTNNPINRLFTDNQKASQKFTIDAQTQQNLKAADGTIIKIAPNSFVTKNGEVVQGEVDFEVKEVYKRSDMVLSNAHTVANDQILISGGEMYMGATRNGEALMLANNKPISVEMPVATDGPTNQNTNMQLFYGRPNGNTVNWNLGSTNSTTPTSNSNVNSGQSYNFNVGAMGWMNCDQFMRTQGNNTKVIVNVPRQFDTTNTAVFVVFKGQNTVTRFDNFSAASNTYNVGSFYTRWYSLPVGSEVTIVAIAEIDGQHYSSMSRTVLANNHVENLMFEPTTMDIFKKEMEKLP